MCVCVFRTRFSALENLLCINQLKPRPSDPRGIAGDSRDLMRPTRGFNKHLTACCPWMAVKLTRCLFHPGHERGFNVHAFFPSFLQKQLFKGINSL